MKKALITPTLLLVMAGFVFGDNYGDYVVDRVDRVYDGDTITVTINGIEPLLGDKIGIRVNGLDTPEIRGGSAKEKEAAYKVRDYVRYLLENSRAVELRNTDRGKYFRIVADVYIDGQNLTQILVSMGYAKPYDGGRKSAWTDEELDYILDN